MPNRLEGDFDYIVVGAGTAGCIMANRLSADPAKTRDYLMRVSMIASLHRAEELG